MDADAIRHYLVKQFEDVQLTEWEGYTFFFLGEERMLPFATLAQRDHEGDRLSQLDRPGIFRLNMGVSRARYRALFGPQPRALQAGESSVEPERDFAALDRLMPHPHYASQSWLCVLSPSAATFETLEPLLADAYAEAQRRQSKRAAPGE